MSENRLKGLAALMGLALVGVIAVGGVVGSASAAADLQPRAERALAGVGLSGIRVELHGREAVLSGGSPDELTRGEKVVEGVEGVRSADIVLGDDLPDAPETPSSPTVTLGRTRAGLMISGTVPNADAAADLKVRAAEDFGVPVIGDLVIDPAVGPARWLTQVPDMFGDVVGIKNLVLRIDGKDGVDLGGAIESRAGAERIRRLVTAAVPGLEVASRLDIQPGDLTESDAAVLSGSTLHFGRGESRLRPDHERALDLVADVLDRNARVSIEVSGHAGPNDPVAGERLSSERVQAVKAYLVRAGIGADRIGTRTYGSGRSATTEPTAKQFRRVDFVVRGV